MKKYFIIIALLNFINNIYPQTTFNKQYSIDSLGVAGFCVTQTLDDGYIMGGTTNNIFVGNKRCYAMKTDCSGNKILEKLYDIFPGVGHEEITKIIQLVDSSYIMCGVFKDTMDIFLMKTDIQGNIIWWKSFGGPKDDVCRDLKITNDNGFVILGYTMNNTNGSDDVYFFKTDNSGNLLWEKRYGTVRSDLGHSILPLSDGGYILNAMSQGLVSDNYDIYLIKTDNAGVMQWQRIYDTPDFEEMHDLKKTKDNGYILVGGKEVNYIQNGYVLKLDSSFNISWSKNYIYNFTNNHFAFLQRIYQLEDSTYIVGGGCFYNDTVQDEGWLLKLNNNGDTLWTKRYGHPTKSDFIYDMVLTKDNGFILCGQYGNAGINPPYPSAWLIKTDSNGCDKDSCNHPCYACGYIEPAFSVSSDTIDLQYTDTIHFYDHSTFAQHWFWNFGDNHTDTTQNPLHVFDTTGTFQVMLIAYFNDCSDTAYYTVVVINSVGIHSTFDIRHSTFVIIPNPANDKVNVLVNEPQAELSVYDIHGLQVLQKHISNKTEIDVSKWQSGVYFIKAVSEKGIFVKKLIKE
ncbi:MAG: T9SS type A sorting domain-containing protein [Bacteroidia bacterium]|nr:T9SS type A sorting domain-containing protein [Bacteroidia bacterium]